MSEQSAEKAHIHRWEDPCTRACPAHRPPTEYIRPLDYLRRIQAESKRYGGRGFHREIGAWVDDNSSVAHVLTALDEMNEPSELEIYDDPRLYSPEDASGVSISPAGGDDR